MPIYEYVCPEGHVSRRYLTLSQFAVSDRTAQCACERMGQLRITAPLMVKACADVRYDSPIDGRPITSWQARQEDLKRNNCVEYDPEQKTDYHNRLKESESSLEKSVEATVEEAIEKMPTAQRGRLHSELIEQGLNTEVIHDTYGT